MLNHYEWAGKKHLVLFKLEYQSGVRTRDHQLSKQAALTLRPAFRVKMCVSSGATHTYWYDPHPKWSMFIRLLLSDPSRYKTLNRCWLNVGPASYDAGPTLNQHRFNVSCLLGHMYRFDPPQTRENRGNSPGWGRLQNVVKTHRLSMVRGLFLRAPGLQ